MSTGLTILIVALLGAVGALVRYGIHEGFSRTGRSVRIATIWANALGSLGLGFVVGADWGPWSLLIAAGLFGALSTLSTLAVDVAELLKISLRRAVGVLLGHILGGLVAFGVGLAIGLLF